MLFLFLKKLFITFFGWFQWKKIKLGKMIGNSTAVILMPSLNTEYNLYTLLYLHDFLESHMFHDALLLTFDRRVLKYASYVSEYPISTVYFSRKNAESIMQYAMLYDFDHRLYIASLDEPTGRRGAELTGSGKITTEELIAIGIFDIFPYKKRACPSFLKELFFTGGM
jgi:hypothetical protein